MSENNDHHRVSNAGRALGSISAMLHDKGRAKLVSEGLGALNLPTLRDTMCASCACRRGTVPNGCLQTQMDLLKSISEAKPFLCHAPKDGRMCAGYAGARAAFVQVGPFPPELSKLIEEWEYSPPDEETPNG
jgi:hypothetical protein